MLRRTADPARSTANGRIAGATLSTDGHEAAPSRRTRRHVTVELRPASEPISAEELRRREEELERLIIKAACRRAARLAALSGQGGDGAGQQTAVVG